MLRTRNKRKAYPWRRRRWRLLLMLVLPVALVVALVAGIRWHLTNKVEARLDMIREAGFPASCEELDAWYPSVPEDENAAPLYQRAREACVLEPSEEDFKALPFFWGQEKALPLTADEDLGLSQPYPEATRTRMSEVLAANALAFDLLHQAAALPRCRYPVDLAHPKQTRFHLLVWCRQAARLLCLRAVMAAEEEDPAVASEALCDALAAARSLKDCPDMVVQLVRGACHRIVHEALMRVLNRTQLTALQAGRLAEALAAEVDPESAIRGYAGERCMNIQHFMGLKPIHLSEALAHGVRRGPRQLRQVRRVTYSIMHVAGGGILEGLHYLDLMDEYIAATRLPRHKGLEVCNSIEERIGWNPKYDESSLSLLIPWRSLQGFAHSEAALHNAMTALAVERYRLDKAALPESLGVLAPDYLEAVLMDPFDGQPLRYKKLDAGYVVYSVGMNKKDDGGLIAKHRHEGDYALRVER